MLDHSKPGVCKKIGLRGHYTRLAVNAATGVPGVRGWGDFFFCLFIAKSVSLCFARARGEVYVQSTLTAIYM